MISRTYFPQLSYCGWGSLFWPALRARLSRLQAITCLLFNQTVEAAMREREKMI